MSTATTPIALPESSLRRTSASVTASPTSVSASSCAKATSACPYVAPIRSSRPIPKAPGHPVLGNMTELLKDPLAFFIKSHKNLGSVFRVAAPTRSYLVMAGMEATRFLLREDGRLFDHKPLYKNVAEELGATHYPISTDGERHHHLRRTLRPALGANRLAQAAPAIASSIGKRVDCTVGQDGVVALDFLHELLGDTVIPALSGRALGGHLRDAVRFARFSVGCGLGAYPAAFRFWPAYRLSKWHMRAFFGELVEAHRSNDTARRMPDFIDDVLAMTDEHGKALSEDNIFALAQLIYSNTLLYVAPTAAFLLHDLLARPGELERCRAEIDAAFKSGTPLFEALSTCTYFVAAKTESMRLNPIGLAAPRVVKEDFTFDGCLFQRGQAVLIANSALHYCAELYPDPYRFLPERHLSPRFESHQAGAFAPLGLGMHSCLAKRLVDAMVLITVGALLHHADLGLPSPGHVLKKRVNPFSEPTRDFLLRVSARR